MSNISQRLPRVIAVVVAAAVLGGLTATTAQASQPVDHAAAEQRFVELVNGARQQAGSRTVRSVADVRDVAHRWSGRMAAARDLTHNPDYSRQYCCWYRASENVGWTTIRDVDDQGQVLAAVERLHQGFMNSDGHRHNILQPDYDHIGVGVVVAEDSCPPSVGGHCVWVTQNFRHWTGEEPSGGVRDPYADVASRNLPAAEVSDDIHEGGFDGDVRTVERLGAEGGTAVDVSRARFAAGTATHAVLSRNDRFPDSLAGAPLTADGPLLFTTSASLHSSVASELRRVLEPGATVYLLGGPTALSADVERRVADLGFAPVRLAGDTRIDTALVIADEVRRLYGDNGQVVVARATGNGDDPDGPAGWVDSITGGAWAAANQVPVVITQSDVLAPSVASWLRGDAPSRTVLLGGEVALSARVAGAVPNPRRVAGGDRTATAAAVAVDLWKVGGAERRFVVIDGWDRGAWQDGLAAAGLAADQGSPMLLVSADADVRPDATTRLVRSCDEPSVDLLLAGGLTNQVADWLEAVDGTSC